MAGTHGDQVPEIMATGAVIIDFKMVMDSVVVDMVTVADVVVVVVVVDIGVDQDRKEDDTKIQVYNNFFIQPSCQFLYETPSLILKQFQKPLFKHNFIEWDDGRKKGSTLPL